MATKKILRKVVKNGEEYYFPEWWWGGGWASDHLEEKALVGELYTLNDEVFIQATPTLENSTIDQEVWNVADNTQIHIQRIASWNASNELKLKIKKVGTPWDLTVQVMKGISVTVTTDVEAYWYWDSNNVLASGTVLASDITTSYQEITVNLGASVGWTKWDLLDIVLSQSSVNASNYYVIACDSTQWSEWYSFVAVNGSTRTRSKLMPYCISDWFSECFLSKASSNNVQTLVKFWEIPSMWKAELYVPMGSWSRWGWQSIHISNPWTYIFDIPDISWWMVNYYWDVRDYSKVKMWIWYDYNTVVLDRWINWDMSAWRAEVNITTEWDYKILFYNGWAYNFQAYPPQRQAISVYQNGDIYKPTNYKEIKIYDEVWLWTEVSAYTFGRMPDWKWFSDKNNWPDYIYYSWFPTCWRLFVLWNIIVFHYALPNYADTWYIKMFDLNTKQYNWVEITTPNWLYMSYNPDTVYIKDDDPTQFWYYYSYSWYSTTYFKFEFKLDGTIVSAYRWSSDPWALTWYTAVPINAESFNMWSKTMYCKDWQLFTLDNNLIYTS